MPESPAPTTPFQQTSQGCALDRVDRWEVTLDGVRVGLQAARARALPWLHIVRAPRFGRGFGKGRASEVVRKLAATAQTRPVLRMHVELWTEDTEEREALAEACRAFGFRRASNSRSYTRTIWMDLSPSEEDLLASFHATGRRHIRAPGKKGYVVRPIDDPEAAPTLEEIFQATFARTDGSHQSLPWREIIRMSRDESARLRLLGLYAEGDSDNRTPLGFVLGMLHGDVAEYSHAGSTRDPTVRVPILYAPTWELMRWARARGARWWDFGGVPALSAPEDDARESIAKFKRYFSTDERDVGEEWVLEPRKAALAAAAAVSRTRGFFGGQRLAWSQNE